MSTPKGTPSGESKPVKAGPVNPIDRPQTLVTPGDLVVENVEPQVGDDGLVYVNDAISEQAVDAGYAADEQPRAHPLHNPPRPTDKELEEAEKTAAANAAALEEIEAPLSVKVEKLAADK